MDEYDAIWQCYTNVRAGEQTALCPQARSFQSLVQEVFSRLGRQPTEARIQDVETLLLEQVAAWEQRLPLFHAISFGDSHQCLQDIYQEALMRLHILRLPTPKAPPAPPQRPRPLTPAQVARNLEAFQAMMPKATYLGDERDEQA